MKNNKLIYSVLFAIVLIGSCKQEVITLKPGPTPVNPPTPTAGDVTFSKFVALGTSYTAGFQAGALFDAGQTNSLAAILNKQFEAVGAPADFKQPTINSPVGFNLFVSPNPDPDHHVFGRFLLQYNGAIDPLPSAQLSDNASIPNLALNANFDYTGATSELNNFSVPTLVLAQALTPATGGPPPPAPNPAYNPFYARFASSPSPDGVSGSKLITDAALSGGTFFFFWLGMDDFLLNAAFGGDESKAPLTDPGTFDTYYGLALGAMLSIPNIKGVVANYPDIFKMPHFTSVPWNAIPFTTSAGDQANMNGANAAYEAYNGGLDQALAGGAAALGLTQDEVNKRKIHFNVGANGSVIEDETLTDLSGFGLPSIRHATAADIFPFAAATVLGTEAIEGDPSSTWGVGKALTDQYALIPSEVSAIKEAMDAFNATVAASVEDNPSKLVLADMEGALETLITHQAAVMNGITITPNIDPPTGIYSEDGIHPNTRGYAFLSTVVITAINNKSDWGAVIPLTDLSLYSATALPIP